MRSQTHPNYHKSQLCQNLENLQKPLFLKCKQHIQASDRGPISNPKPLINTPRNQTINLVIQNTKKSPKCHQLGSQKGIPNPPKIYKNPCLDSHVSPWVPLGTLCDSLGYCSPLASTRGHPASIWSFFGASCLRGPEVVFSYVFFSTACQNSDSFLNVLVG